MQTSKQWWDATKKDSALLAEWLRKQFHGEVTASSRIAEMADGRSQMECRVLYCIAAQEVQHAVWVHELLINRGIDPGHHDEKARYWKQVQPASFDFEHKAAVATLAEGMRLERIRVIAADEEAPADIREVFRKILVDEEWHEREFAKMTNDAVIEEV